MLAFFLEEKWLQGLDTGSTEMLPRPDVRTRHGSERSEASVKCMSSGVQRQENKRPRAFIGGFVDKKRPIMHTFHWTIG